MAQLVWVDIYGWRFLDDPSLTHDWPAEPSLTLDIGSPAGSHWLFWFNECGRTEGETNVAYCIEGTVAFEGLEVLRADATLQPLHEFISEGQRYWQALYGRHERLSVEAQQAAQDGTPSWQPYVRYTVTNSGSGDAEPTSAVSGNLCPPLQRHVRDTNCDE